MKEVGPWLNGSPWCALLASVSADGLLGSCGEILLIFKPGDNNHLLFHLRSAAGGVPFPASEPRCHGAVRRQQ